MHSTGIKIILRVRLVCLLIHCNCSTLWAELYHENFPINLQEPDNWGTWLLLHHSLLLHIPITLHQFHLFRSNSNTNLPHIYPIRVSPFLPYKFYSYNHVCYYSFQVSHFSVDGLDDRRIDSIPGRSKSFLPLWLPHAGWETVLQVERSRVRFPVVSSGFFIDIILPAALWALKVDTVSNTKEYQEFYIWVSVHHKSVINNKTTRCNSGRIVFINNYKYALHVSDALCVHHQKHHKL